jgi:hypothetical protein
VPHPGGREGIVLTPEIPLSELQKYVGSYREAASAAEFTILIRNQRLAVRLPNNTSFDLLPPDATGLRASSANVGLGVTFEESQTGAVSAMNVHSLSPAWRDGFHRPPPETTNCE